MIIRMAQVLTVVSVCIHYEQIPIFLRGDHQVSTRTRTRIILHTISFLQESLILNQAKEY